MSIARALVALTLLMLGVGCWEKDDGPCSGCTYRGRPTSVPQFVGDYGSPGGTTLRATLPDFDGDAGVLTVSAVADRYEIESLDLPQIWQVDGGTDAGADDASARDASDAGDADADAADAADAAALGWARGYGARGRIAVIDLGDTPSEEGSSPLVNAFLHRCSDARETLVDMLGDAGAVEGYACRSAVDRAAVAEPLDGTATYESAGTTIEGTTASGAQISIRSSPGRPGSGHTVTQVVCSD